MLRRAATRSCSTMTVSLCRISSLAGDSVPQNGQTRRCLAGFHCASPPHAGQWYFACAVTTVSVLAASGLGSGNQNLRLLQELRDLGARDAPLRPDLLALEIARLQAGDDVGFG